MGRRQTPLDGPALSQCCVNIVANQERSSSGVRSVEVPSIAAASVRELLGTSIGLPVALDLLLQATVLLNQAVPGLGPRVPLEMR